MKIICYDREIRTVFENGYYLVPRFQRAYSWERDHIVDFWNDVIVDCDEDYFIGSMVVFRERKELLGIVDGQQRLTTITLFLCALRNAYRTEEMEDLAKGVHSLVEKIDLDNKLQYVLQTETSSPYLQRSIQQYNGADRTIDQNAEEINLGNAFDLINKYIEEEINIIKQSKANRKEEFIKDFIKKRLNEIRDRMLSLKIILVELENEDDACTIFETINTRGKDLSVGDLIKNHLIKFIKVNNRQLDLPKNNWNQLRDNIDSIGDVNIDTFLLHVWLSRYEYTALKTLYKKFKLTIKRNELKVFLEMLVSDSVIYKNIFDPESRKWEKNQVDIKRNLIHLNNFRITQQIPMVLTILRELSHDRIKPRMAADFLYIIEKFHYLFTAISSQRSSGGIAAMYSSFARKLTNAANDRGRNKILEELKQKMREKLPTIDEFIAGFKKLKFTNEFTKHKKLIHYTLAKIDAHYSSRGLIVDYDHMTIEHIYAQNPRPKSAGLDVPVGQIGNLILVSETLNVELSNKDYLTKKKIMNNAKIFIDEIYTSAEKWDKDAIEQRTNYLAKLAYEEVFRI